MTFNTFCTTNFVPGKTWQLFICKGNKLDLEVGTMTNTKSVLYRMIFLL
jgi:hypothetical protein